MDSQLWPHRGKAGVQLSSSPLWAWDSTILAPTHMQPPKTHLILTLPVPSCESDITKQHATHRTESRGSHQHDDGTAREEVPSTFWLCHCSVWALATSHPFPLGSGFPPVKWGCPGSSCGRLALFSFGLKFPSSERYSLTMVIKIAPFPSLQLSSLQRSILFLS